MEMENIERYCELIKRIEKQARTDVFETLLDLEDVNGVITLTARELIRIAQCYGIIIGN